MEEHGELGCFYVDNVSPFGLVSSQKSSIEHLSRLLLEYCRLSDASVRKYLNSGTLLGIDIVAAISKHTACSLSWLITREVSKHDWLGARH